MKEKNAGWKCVAPALFALIAVACSNGSPQWTQPFAMPGYRFGQSMPQLVQEEGTCFGMRLQSGCWAELQNEPGCYVWQQDTFVTGASLTWSGGCSKGLAKGKGTLTIAWTHPWYREAKSVQEGELQDGRKTGVWELRHPDLVERGEYWNGHRAGTWEIIASNGWRGTAQYNAGPRVLATTPKPD